MIPDCSNLGLSGIDTIDQLQNVHFDLLSFSNAKQRCNRSFSRAVYGIWYTLLIFASVLLTVDGAMKSIENEIMLMSSEINTGLQKFRE